MADEARVRKVQERILQTVASMIGRHVKDPRLELVTITDVRVTGDLQHASISTRCLATTSSARRPRARSRPRRSFRSAWQGARSAPDPTLEFIPDALPEARRLEDALAKAKAKDDGHRRRVRRRHLRRRGRPLPSRRRGRSRRRGMGLIRRGPSTR